MNAPFLIAQATGPEVATDFSAQSKPPRLIKIARPQDNQAVTVHLDGNTKLDLSDVASDKITFVRVGDRLVILFDNQATVTIEPAFGPDGQILGDITFQVGPDRQLSGAEFAAAFPVGGSNSTGILGYVVAAQELHDQRPDIDKIIVPVGSAGTAAGLAAGIKMLNWPVTLVGACVSHTETESREDVRRLAGDIDIQVTDRAVGPGYGIPTEEMWAAVRLFAATEGVTLEPVYNGKAAAALVDMIRNGEIGDDETVVFLHTGGLPGLFAYAPDLTASV